MKPASGWRSQSYNEIRQRDYRSTKNLSVHPYKSVISTAFASSAKTRGHSEGRRGVRGTTLCIKANEFYDESLSDFSHETILTIKLKFCTICDKKKLFKRHVYCLRAGTDKGGHENMLECMVRRQCIRPHSLIPRKALKSWHRMFIL